MTARDYTPGSCSARQFVARRSIRQAADFCAAASGRSTVSTNGWSRTSLAPSRSSPPAELRAPFGGSSDEIAARGNGAATPGGEGPRMSRRLLVLVVAVAALARRGRPVRDARGPLPPRLGRARVRRHDARPAHALRRRAGRVGRDLEENAARLVEIDRMEVLSVHNRTDADALAGQRFAPVHFGFIGRRTPRDMMHDARAQTAVREGRIVFDKQVGVRAVTVRAVRPIADTVRLRSIRNVLVMALGRL